MNTTVVHDNYRVGCWKRLHTVQEPADEGVKQAGIKCAFNNVAMKDAFGQGQRREYGETV